MDIYLFREEGSNAHLPFGTRFEKQLALALDHSSKFMFAMRNGLLSRRELSHTGGGEALGLLTLLMMMGIIRILNRSVCYNLRSRENRTLYILVQIGFGLTLLSAG